MARTYGACADWLCAAGYATVTMFRTLLGSLATYLVKAVTAATLRRYQRKHFAAMTVRRPGSDVIALTSGEGAGGRW